MEPGTRKSSSVEVTPALLREMTEAIVQAVRPQQIVLFGSQARGRGHAHSDVDLLVIEDGSLSGQERLREMAELKRVLAPFRVSKDVLVYSQAEVERWRHTKNHVIARALREGRVLYERP